MLTPEYLWDVADPVVDIWEELNIAMIIDICERLMSADLYDYHQLPGAARYEAWLANQYGMHYEEMVKVIAELTKKSESEVKNLFEEAGLLTLENDQMIYDNHNISPIDIRNNSTLSQMLTEMYTRTNGELKNYTRTTLQNMPDEFYHAMDKAYTAVASGVESYSKAISDTVEELSKEGTHVTYPTGHKDSIDVAVRRAVLTGLNQGAAQISLQNAIDNGYEYVVVDAHLGARVNDKNKIANHAGWQGKIFKIEGKTKDHGNLKEETGFPGDPLGLCGYNCRHNFYPYMLGDPNPFEEDIPDEKENWKAYENSQKQRSMERKIRESKRNLMGLQTCIDNCQDDKTRFDLQQEYNKKADRLQKQNKAYKEFCEENGLKTEQERLKAAGWNRESANQARSGAKQYKDAGKPGAKSVGYGEEVYFDENKSYTVNVPEFSEELNMAISGAAKKVAETGSEARYEYASVIDMETGAEVDFGTSEDHSSVNSYYKFLRGHKDGKYIMVHNHNTLTGLSLPDIQELEMWSNMHAIVSVTNNGYINVAISNGAKTSEYLYSRYKDARYDLLKSGKSSGEVEKELVKLAVREFVAGEIKEYE
ncbi:MAG: phage minor capsid protein [Agathobacter sp.]|nr:phage minor capsid protein [Agathobacter sp.]